MRDGLEANALLRRTFEPKGWMRVTLTGRVPQRRGANPAVGRPHRGEFRNDGGPAVLPPKRGQLE